MDLQNNKELVIKKTEEKDSETILYLIREQAIYEKGLDECVITLEQIKKYCFGKDKQIEAYIGYNNDKPVGFLMFYYYFSTRIGEPGVYLEEIHVLEKERKKGFGKKLLDFVVKFAQDNGYKYVLWRTQVWNEGAQGFYKKHFANPIPYTQMRLDYDLIQKIANNL